MSNRNRGRRRKRLSEEAVEVQISALSNEGRGIAHVDERTVFVDQALPGETVLFKYTGIKKNIAEGDVLCIIEAMKLFNEIESEVSGKVVKILVDDSTPVEFDQPLFLVDPS